jgi:uncharacterized protein (DUF362 family)
MSERKITRRQLLIGSAVGAAVGVPLGLLLPRRPDPSVPRVWIGRARSYADDLEGIIRAGLREFPELAVRGKRVLLKPNMVEYLHTNPINTATEVVVGAAQAFLAFGAAEVVVAEGPGHRRDLDEIISVIGLRSALRERRIRFVDLNHDDWTTVPNRGGRTQLAEFHLPDTLLGADLIVSLPKLKTHHWAGVTLSMKNFFGVMPGAVYGWPKNILHWRGIEHSILDIVETVRPHFAIVDGVIGMEGNGPIQGEAVQAGLIVMGTLLRSVDATCTRLMSLRPERVGYLQACPDAFGPLEDARILQLGEEIRDVRRRFSVLEPFRPLLLDDATGGR